MLLDRRSRGKDPGWSRLAKQQAAAPVRSLRHERGKRADVAQSSNFTVKDTMLYKRKEDRRLVIEAFRTVGLPV